MLPNILAKMGRPTVDVAMFVLPETVRGLSNHEFNTIKSAIEKAAGSTPLEVSKLIQSLPHPTEKSITVIRFLADNDPQFQLFDGYLRIMNPTIRNRNKGCGLFVHCCNMNE